MTISPVLQTCLIITLILYCVSGLLGLYRLMRGPSAQDRVLAMDFIYLLAMLIILALGIRNSSSMYLEAALLIAITGFVSSAAMAKFLLRGEVIE